MGQLVIGSTIEERTIIRVPPSTEETVIEVTTLRIRGDNIRLAYRAPTRVEINREVIDREKQRDKQRATREQRDAANAKAVAAMPGPQP